jgi:phosphatidylglycerol---prolipoprotein diacylglyceryl transferase
VLIAIDPVVLNLGPLAVRWFGLLALAGLGLATWRSLRALEREGLPRKLALDALAWGLPAGVLVARLVHVLGWWDYYLTHGPELWQLNIDGLSLWGGLLGGSAIAFARLHSKRNPLRRRRILDVIAPNLALGIALGRFGAFLDGHGQGLPSDLPWATQYASPLAATPDFGVSRQPAQLYDALVALALFLLVSNLPRRWPAGSRLAVFLVLYSSARLLLGSVRLDPAFLFGLQLEQILALGGLGFGAWYGLRPVFSARLFARGARTGPEPAAADGRLTDGVTLPLRATLYMKADCHLCEVTIGELERLRERHPHTLELVDISTDDDLMRQYWERIPVLKVAGREYDAPLVPAILDRALLQAAAEQHRTASTTPQKTPDRATPSEADQRQTIPRRAALGHEPSTADQVQSKAG